jgi:hypothetical protein
MPARVFINKDTGITPNRSTSRRYRRAVKSIMKRQKVSQAEAIDILKKKGGLKMRFGKPKVIKGAGNKMQPT